MAFITVFEHLKFGKEATMNSTTNWGQFVVAKHDTKIQTVTLTTYQVLRVQKQDTGILCELSPDIATHQVKQCWREQNQ